MRTGSRLATLGVLAIMPTAVSIVAPMGVSGSQPRPVRAEVSTHALREPGIVAPAAVTLAPDDATEARELAGGRDISVEAASAAVTMPDGLAVVGVTWTAGSGQGVSVQYRTLSAGAWGDWSFLDVDPDHRPEAAEEAGAAKRGKEVRQGSDPLVVKDRERVQVRVIGPTSLAAPAKPRLEVIAPSAPSAETRSALPGAAVAATQQPRIYTRAEWGADESLRDQSEPSYGVVDAAFVHHTVGTNNYTSAEVPGLLQGIYEYHVGTYDANGKLTWGRGWRDIGYNFFVDRFGRTWEGRYGGMDRAVVGAHAYGVNDATFGVSVLGNFEEAQPPAAALTAITNLVAWKADVHGYNPAGTATIDGVTYPAVEGHRAAKDNSTLCPGQYLYAKLPEIRKAAGAITDGSGRSTERWSGSDRFATAAAVSAGTFPTGAPVAFVATGSDFPDALAGGPAGAKLGGPMLLTGRDSLPQSTYAELQRLKPQKIVVLGSNGVVSEAVKTQLASLAGEVQRWAGPDRYATAATTSAQAFPNGAPVAFVSTGANFPDALAGGPAGDQLGGPMLLSARDTLPAATVAELKRLGPTRIVLLGGSDVVSDAVSSQIYSATGVLPGRWSGVDRYSTAAKVSAEAFPGGSDVAFVSTGADFPDALAGGPAGGALDAPLLLTGRDALPQSTIDELKRLTPSRIIVLGGDSVVSAAVATGLRSYIVP
jgi:putative cell wall-binding protein